MEELQPHLVWSAQLTDIGAEEFTYARQGHISRQVLQQTCLELPNKGEHIEIFIQSLQFSGVGQIGFSQQEFETLHDIFSKVAYVQGGWLSSFVFKVTSTRFRRLLSQIAFPALGRWGPAAMDDSESRRLSTSSACNGLQAIAGGIRRLAYVLCLHRKVAYSQQ